MMKQLLIITPSPISADAVGVPLMLHRLLAPTKTRYAVLSRDTVSPAVKNQSALLKYTLGNITSTRKAIKALVSAGEKLIAEAKPTELLITSDTGPCLIAGYILAKKYNLPYSLFFFDLWRGNFLKPYDALLARIYERKIITGARRLITAGEGLKEELDRVYGVSSAVVNNPLPHEAEAALTAKGQHATPVLLYPGSVYWAQADSLRSINEAAATLDVRIQVYTPQSAAAVAALGLSGNKIEVHPQRPSAEIIELERSADILLLPLSFQNYGRRVIATASPGKMSEFLASGTPILCVAPSYSFISRFLKSQQAAVVVNELSVEAVRTALTQLLADRKKQRSLSERARTIALREYTVDTNSVRLTNALGL